MGLKKLYLQDFRLFNQNSFEIQENTLITGINGSGKTSILEAVHLILTGKSHKTTELRECIKDGYQGFKLALEGNLGHNHISLRATKTQKKRLLVTKKKDQTTGKATDFPIVRIILANNLRMIEGEPDLRRDFFNKTMFHVEQNSLEAYKEYQKALVQRNKALKGKLSEKELQVWTGRLLESGIKLDQKNKSFFQKLNKSILGSLEEDNHKENTAYLTGLGVQLFQGWNKDKDLGSFLSETINKDKILGYTSGGPHRLDLIISIKKKLAKSTLSRGQQKLLILLMYLYSDGLLRESHEGGIVYLVDDITSELDEGNLRIILEKLVSLKSQVIITSLKDKIENKNYKLLDNFKQIKL